MALIADRIGAQNRSKTLTLRYVRVKQDATAEERVAAPKKTSTLLGTWGGSSAFFDEIFVPSYIGDCRAFRSCRRGQSRNLYLDRVSLK